MTEMPKVTVLSGWKRTGKTSLGSYIMCCWMEGEINKMWPGARAMGIDFNRTWHTKTMADRIGLIGGRSLNHVEDVLLKIYRDMLPPSKIKHWFTHTRPSISTIGKFCSKCVVRTYEQSLEVWKSGAYDMIHLDEEPPFEILKECLDRTRTTNGRIIITVALDDADLSYLPELCSNPMKVIGTDSFMHLKLGIEDVPTEIYPLEEKEQTLRMYSGTPFEPAVRYGEFAYVSGRWWPDFDINVHVIKEFPIPKNWKRFRFIDAGMAAPCACLWIALSPNNVMFVYREYYKKGTLISERCKDIIEMSGNQRQKDGYIYIEQEINEKYEMTQLDHAEFSQNPQREGGVDFEYVKEGLSVMPWSTLGQEARRDKTRKWLHVNKTEKHFITHESGAPRLYIMDSCANLIWEAQKKTFKKTFNERSSTLEIKIQNKDDHAMDCLEAACCEMMWAIDDRVIV
jgi:phage terminase large subunit-like protein